MKEKMPWGWIAGRTLVVGASAAVLLTAANALRVHNVNRLAQEALRPRWTDVNRWE